MNEIEHLGNYSKTLNVPKKKMWGITYAIEAHNKGLHSYPMPKFQFECD